ncbi:MAG: hypothetical protein AB1894_08640 [Chloroflexota bacterium]
MPDAFDLNFEIDYPHQRAGWMDCYLTWNGQRRHLWASSVFPPFLDVLDWLRAIHAQRLPHSFMWDEEGKGAVFEAWPVAPDSPLCRVHICYWNAEAPWVEAELDRQALIQAFLSPLKEFARRSRRAAGWGLTKAVISDFERFQRRAIPPRSDLTAAEPLAFAFRRSDQPRSPVQWMDIRMWGLLLITWMLDDGDPFWPEWFAFLEQVAAGRLPAGFEWCNLHLQQLVRDMRQAFDLPAPEVEPVCNTIQRADPLEQPHLFRLAITESDDRYQDFLRLDEVLERRQFVDAFCQAFEKFLAEDYELLPGEDGSSFDLRSLPLERLKSLV